MVKTVAKIARQFLRYQKSIIEGSDGSILPKISQGAVQLVFEILNREHIWGKVVEVNRETYRLHAGTMRQLTSDVLKLADKARGCKNIMELVTRASKMDKVLKSAVDKGTKSSKKLGGAGSMEHAAIAATELCDGIPPLDYAQVPPQVRMDSFNSKMPILFKGVEYPPPRWFNVEKPTRYTPFIIMRYSWAGICR